MTMKFTLEILREVWDDESGDHIEIGPDRDGLGCIEIRYKDKNGKIEERMTFHPEMARLVAQAVLKCADELGTPSKTS